MSVWELHELPARDLPSPLGLEGPQALRADVLHDETVRMSEGHAAVAVASEARLDVIGLMHPVSVRIIPGNLVVDVRPGHTSIPLPADAQMIEFADDDEFLGGVRVDDLRKEPRVVAAYAGSDVYLPPEFLSAANKRNQEPSAFDAIDEASADEIPEESGSQRLVPLGRVTQEPLAMTAHKPQQPWVDPLSEDPWRRLAASASGPMLDELLKYFEQRNARPEPNVAPPPREKIIPSPAETMTPVAPVPHTAPAPAPKIETPVPPAPDQPMQPPEDEEIAWAIEVDNPSAQTVSRPTTQSVIDEPPMAGDVSSSDVQKLAVLGALSVVIGNPPKQRSFWSRLDPRRLFARG